MELVFLVTSPHPEAHQNRHRLTENRVTAVTGEGVGELRKKVERSKHTKQLISSMITTRGTGG